MIITVYPKPSFAIPLSAATVALLVRMSSLHYDMVCKQAGAVGGFLYGWNNSVTFMPEASVTATWREADTTLKICENCGLYPVGSDAREDIADLTKTIRAAMRAWTAASEDWSVSTTPALLQEAERANQ